MRWTVADGSWHTTKLREVMALAMALALVIDVIDEV
jgi:hypothetical protein